ncbi:MAG: type II secretion system protein [Thermoguttaceae bacterium]
MKRRSGYMLVELLVVIAIGSVMLGMAVSLLYALMRLDRENRAQAHQFASFARLAEQFRDDVHTARDWPGPQGDAPQKATAPSWKLQCAGGREVQYHAERGGLLRTEVSDGQIRKRELYRLPSEVAATIGPRDGVAPTVLCLRIAPVAGQSVKAALLHPPIEAVLGKSLRFAKPQAVEKP